MTNGFKNKRPKSSPEAVAKILSLALKRYGLEKKVAQYAFVQHWSEIVGPEVAKRTKPESIHRGVLMVRVTNSVWAQELSMRRSEFLARLKPLLTPDTQVNDIQFRVGV